MFLRSTLSTNIPYCFCGCYELPNRFDKFINFSNEYSVIYSNPLLSVPAVRFHKCCVDNYRHTRLMPCSLGLPLACRPCSLHIVEQGHFGGSYLISSLWSLLSHQRIWALRGETQVETWLNLPHLFITLDYVKILVYFSPLFLVKKGTFPLSSWIRY